MQHILDGETVASTMTAGINRYVNMEAVNLDMQVNRGVEIEAYLMPMILDMSG